MEASERIHLARVASDTLEVEMLQHHLQIIGDDVRNCVRVKRVARIPIFGDAFVASIVHEVAVLTGNRKESLEDVAVQNALRILLGLV